MKRRRCARALLAGGISVIALAGGTGIARAQPEPEPEPPLPPVIDQFITSTPILSVNPTNQGGPVWWGGAGRSDRPNNWGGVGMYCENPSVRCR
jgi:hypothetical protein